MERLTYTQRTEDSGRPGAEQSRLAESPDLLGSPWRLWGPYVSERAWGTVREDYSENGDAWNYFPHDHARSRAYWWNEDGLAAICDINQYLCFGLALWNGRDPVLKERIFASLGRREITARMPRSTGGISIPPRPTHGSAGAITTPRLSSPTPA
jgi:hypothetical protein